MTEIIPIRGPSPVALGNNKYIFAIATAGSSFGTLGSTQVVDANGAGISGTFSTGQAFPSGNGLAGSTFEFRFSVLPDDGKQQALVNSADASGAKALLNQRETTSAYNPYFDYNGAGVIGATDAAETAAVLNSRQSGIIAPTAPSDSQQVGTTGSSGFTALELGVQETGSSTSLTAGSSPAATTSGGNNVSTASSLASTTPASTTSRRDLGSGDWGASSTTTLYHHGRHDYPATDAAVLELDLADLYG